MKERSHKQELVTVNLNFSKPAEMYICHGMEYSNLGFGIVGVRGQGLCNGMFEASTALEPNSNFWWSFMLSCFMWCLVYLERIWNGNLAPTQRPNLILFYTNFILLGNQSLQFPDCLAIRFSLLYHNRSSFYFMLFCFSGIGLHIHLWMCGFLMNWMSIRSDPVPNHRSRF